MSLLTLIMGGGGGPFSPLDLPWSEVLWAEDPAWTNPGDGNPVSSWRNAGSIGSAGDATGSGATRPIYRAAYANLNNKPAVEFDGTGLRLITGTLDIAQPCTHVLIGWTDNFGTYQAGLEGGIVAGERQVSRIRHTSTLVMAGVNVCAFGARVEVGEVYGTFYFNGASSAAEVNNDAFNAAAIGDVGSDSLDHFLIGTDATFDVPTDGAWVLVGVLPRALTPQERTDLRDWANTHYGMNLT